MKFQLLTAAIMKMVAFWDITLYSLIKVDRRFICHPEDGDITPL
jgi:hypothetical protein